MDTRSSNNGVVQPLELEAATALPDGIRVATMERVQMGAMPVEQGDSIGGNPRPNYAGYRGLIPCII